MAKPRFTRSIGYVVSGRCSGKRKDFSGYIDTKKEAMEMKRRMEKEKSEGRINGKNCGIIKDIRIRKEIRPNRLRLVDSRFGG